MHVHFARMQMYFVIIHVYLAMIHVRHPLMHVYLILMHVYLVMMHVSRRVTVSPGIGIQTKGARPFPNFDGEFREDLGFDIFGALW